MGILKNILKESKFKSNNTAILFGEIKKIKDNYQTSFNEIFEKYNKVQKKLESIEKELIKENINLNKIDCDFQLKVDTDINIFKQIEIELDLFFNEIEKLNEEKLDDLFENLFGRLLINSYLKGNKYHVYLLIK